MADRMYQFGFIGMGNMGYAILKGLLGVYSPEKITFSSGKDSGYCSQDRCKAF